MAWWKFITKIIKPVEPLPQPAPIISKDKFISLTGLVIDGLEGGYYHPSMKSRFNAKSQALLGDSGETLFGIDRKHGIQLAKYPEWAIFWAEVDGAKKVNPADFGYNKRGGASEAKLKALAASIMYQWFSYLAKKYLKSEALKYISEDDRLLLHFSYSSWNGEGWFKRYANALTSAIKKYPNDKEQVFQEAYKARSKSSNPVIRQQGTNMWAIFKKQGLV